MAVGYMTVTATLEVRDGNGDLVSSEPVEAQIPVTAEQHAALTQGETS
jgi:hypothetical protein